MWFAPSDQQTKNIWVYDFLQLKSIELKNNVIYNFQNHTVPPTELLENSVHILILRNLNVLNLKLLVSYLKIFCQYSPKFV